MTNVRADGNCRLCGSYTQSITFESEGLCLSCSNDRGETRAEIKCEEKRFAEQTYILDEVAKERDALKVQVVVLSEKLEHCQGRLKQKTCS